MSTYSYLFFSGLILGLCCFWAPVTASAQCVSLTTLGSAYTQNFDTLSNVAGSTTNNLTIPGWFMTEGGGGALAADQSSSHAHPPTSAASTAVSPARTRNTMA